MNKLIHGKNTEEGIVGVEINGNEIVKFYSNGNYTSEKFNRYIITKSPSLSGEMGTLSGNQELRYFSKYSSQEEFNYARRAAPYGYSFVPRDDQQSLMLKTGITYYKGMTFEDLNVLAIDIETNGLTMNKDSKIYLISVATRSETRLFSLDEYPSQYEMITSFFEYVNLINPHVIIGHNIFKFDLPYIANCYNNSLQIGRFMFSAEISHKERLFRKDGHKSYTFNNIKAYGRDIIDTMFLAMKYDVGNKYNSYGLKSIIKDEGLEQPGRVFYDAKTIKDNWDNPVERAKIKEYCKDDARDTLNLFNKLAPQYFYYTQILPCSFQETILSATGTHINLMMLRSYLQDGKSIPLPSETTEYEGGISYGNPGIYRHINKVDVASLYPSIILSYKIYDKVKDPDANFLKIVGELTKERLENKKKAKDTGLRYYDDLQSAQKIVINSAYGFLAAGGLNYNSPDNAAQITRAGREILERGIGWAKKRSYQIVNVDTDSFTYSTGDRVLPETFKRHISDLNELYPNGIHWENDGQYRTAIIAKAKNYVLEDYDGKVVIKGSGLKATMKEPALKEFLENAIKYILEGCVDDIVCLYEEYVDEIMNIKDIKRWAFKKTVTKAVLKAGRTNERRILDAIDEDSDEGDKVELFFKTPTELCSVENFDGEYDRPKLLEKLYKTVKILENVLDITLFRNYKLKKNYKIALTVKEIDEDVIGLG